MLSNTIRFKIASSNSGSLIKSVETGFVHATLEKYSDFTSGFINIPDLIKSGAVKSIAVKPNRKNDIAFAHNSSKHELDYLDCDMDIEVDKGILPNITSQNGIGIRRNTLTIPFGLQPSGISSKSSVSTWFREYLQNEYWNKYGTPDFYRNSKNESVLYNLLKENGMQQITDKVDAIIEFSNLHILYTLLRSFKRNKSNGAFSFDKDAYEQTYMSTRDIEYMEKSIKEWIQSIKNRDLTRSYSYAELHSEVLETYESAMEVLDDTSKNVLNLPDISEELKQKYASLTGKSPIFFSNNASVPEGIMKASVNRDILNIYVLFAPLCNGPASITSLYGMFKENLQKLIKADDPEERMFGIYLYKAFQVDPKSDTPPAFWNDISKWLLEQEMMENVSFRDPVKLYNLISVFLRDQYTPNSKGSLCSIRVSDSIRIPETVLFNRYNRLNWEYGFFFIQECEGEYYLCFKIGTSGDLINSKNTSWRNMIVLCKFPLENRVHTYAFTPETDGYLVSKLGMSSIEQFLNFLMIQFRCTFGKDSEKFPIQLGCFQRRCITHEDSFIIEETSIDTDFMSYVNGRLSGTLLMRNVPNPENPEEMVPLWYRLSLLMSEDMSAAYRKVYRTESEFPESFEKYNHKVKGPGDHLVLHKGTQKDEAYRILGITELIKATIVNVHIAAMIESLSPMGFDMASGIVSTSMLQELFEARDDTDERFISAVKSIENAIREVVERIDSYAENTNTDEFIIDVFPRINGAEPGSRIDVPEDNEEHENFFREFLYKLSPNNDMLDCKLLNKYDVVVAPLLACLRRMCRAKQNQKRI